MLHKIELKATQIGLVIEALKNEIREEQDEQKRERLNRTLETILKQAEEAGIY